MIDVAIIGGGPAGLATAIGAASAGLEVHLFDKQQHPIDKACGEGLLPSGLSALDRLGALALLDRSDSAPFDSILYVQANGTRAEGQLPPPGGLGIRRLALSNALRARADQLKTLTIHERTGIRGHRVDADQVTLDTDQGEVKAKILIGADGLHSQVRERAGLGGEPAPLERFGLRRHVALTPWGRSVEVHFAPGIEAYVTPSGTQRVGIAFLWEKGALDEKAQFEALLAHFPELEAKVKGAAFDSTARGSGPLWQNVKRRVAPRIALVGDAAGYVDAITGEGITQSLEGAEALAAILPHVIANGGSIESFAAYEKHARASFARYARLAKMVLFAARHPFLRGTVLDVLSASPALFRGVLRAAL